MSLFRKFFLKKPPDGLLEISERVYVFDYCFTMDVLEESKYKEYVGGIIKQLHNHFPDASFMVFNFREGDNESQIANILCEYDMMMVDYPRQYEGCPLLTTEMIHHYLRSGESWLQLGQQNVLLMHCERSGWPVLAFMLAALLIYRKQYTGEQKTLDMIYKQANPEPLQLMSPLNPLPSQLRYLQYISRRNVGPQWPPLDRALTLDCVIIRFIPNMDEEGGCRPIFRIYGPDPFMAADRTSKLLFSTPKRSKLVRHYKQADCELAKIDIHCHVQGNVVLECINLGDDLEHEQMIFRVMFNTAFIRSNILMLNRDEIDILWNIADDQFPKDFRVEVLFSDMDASSVISIDLPCIEDKEGLPVEAFAKVQEIFSNADWLGSKTEVANVLQQIKVSNILLERLDSGVSATTSSLLKESLSGKFTFEPKRLLENDIKNLASNVQGNPSNSSFKSSVETSPEKKIEPLELKTSSENNIRNPASIGPGKQCIPLVGLSIASNILPEKLDSGVSDATSNSPKESLSGKFEFEPKRPPGIDIKNLASKFQGIPSVSSFQSSFDTSPNQKIETTVAKASSESNIKSPASIGPGKHSVFSIGLLTNSDSNKIKIEALESREAIMDQGKQSTPLIEPAMDENLIKKKTEPLESMTMSENDIKSPTSSPQLKQSVPSFQPAIDANSIKKKIEPQELQVVLQLPAQSKIISTRVHQASRSAPVPYCTSLQGSTVPISRYQSAPSGLGITALLQDHVVMDTKEEVTHTIAEPTPSTVSPSVSKVPRSIEPSSLCIPPALLPSLSLKSSLDASTAVEKTFGSIPLTTAATPPPPCTPQLHQPTPNLMQSVAIQHQEITMNERSQKSMVSRPLPPPPSPPGATKSSFATPPPPPPPPTSSSLKSSFSTPPLSPSAQSQAFSFPGKSPYSVVKDSIITQPPPPPPPPPPQTSTEQTLFSKSPSPPPSESMNNSAIISDPPPPPRHSGITSGPVSSSVPPPPAPPNSASRNSVSKNCTTVPPVPPPLSPYPNLLSKSGTAPLQSPPSVGNGNVPPPVPGPSSGVPFGAKGRGPLRATPKGQTQTKRSNLKPYHWLKLTRVVQGSLWAETQKLDDASKAPEFDMSELESLFSAVAPNFDHGRKGSKSNRRASRPKADKVQLIELRRAYNCEIMLSKVKIPMPDLMSSVLSLDDSALDVDHIENLIKFCPTKEEMELLKGYNGDKDNLGKCEQFFLELMKVPRVELKLRVFSFKIQFCSQVSELRRNLNIVNSASEEIRNSVKLKRIMQTILSLGNTLNHGTARGSAVGFRLDSLLKLTDTRAQNNKMTLMHYLCKVLAEKLPELLDFPKDLVSLEASTKIQLKYLAEEMQAISKGLEKVVQESTASENDGPVSENFCKILKEFLCGAEAEVRSLAQRYSIVGRNADALTLYFGEDPARCPFEQVVSTLHNFVKMFVRAHEENCKQLEFERKRAEKEAEQEKLKLAAKMECEQMVRTPIKSGRIK